MGNCWERLLRSIQEKSSGETPGINKKPEAAPEETPQGDSAVVQAATPAKRTRKTKPKVEQQAEPQQDV